jgi:hypothetical protein
MTESGKPSGTRPYGKFSPTFGSKSFADFVSASWKSTSLLEQQRLTNELALRIGQLERRRLCVLRNGAATLFDCSWLRALVGAEPTDGKQREQ